MNNLIARFADCTFWLARYMERAENLARILDVNETFARDQQGANHWLPIVQLHSDGQRFEEAYGQADAESVIRFYLLDQQNPASIISSVSSARDNARVLRHLISTEMWAQLNVLHHRLLEVNADTPIVPRLSRMCSWIKEGCQAHYGITEGTLYRDQAWYFYQIGKMIERADQTTRLLDINYHSPLSNDDRDRDAESAQWNSVLRSVAGYHAFRRTYPRGMEPEAVASFLLFDEHFPRSLSLCLAEIDSLHVELEETFGLQDNEAVSKALDTLSAHISGRTMTDLTSTKLHESLDLAQQNLIALTDSMRRSYFGYA